MQGAITALAGRAVQLMKRVGLEVDYALAGGMTQNQAMIEAIATKLSAPLNLPPQGLGQFNGAFGAALLGMRRAEKLLSEGQSIPAPGSEHAHESDVYTPRRWSMYMPASIIYVDSTRSLVKGTPLKVIHSTRMDGKK